MLLIVLALSLPAVALAGGRPQELEKLNRFVQTTSSSNAAAVKVFREGRDLLEDEEWSKAAAVFSEFIRAYPSDKNVDAALYYLAFSQKKMAKYQESVATLQRLLNDHSKSSWINDARAMRIELASLLGNQGVIEDELAKNDAEIKSIALQGMFQNNPDRAAEVATEILKPDSKASRRLKENALNMLGQYRGKQSSAIFLDVARRNTDMKLRRSAIYWLGRTGDETILNGLRDMAVTSTEREISRAALGAIAQQSGTRPNEILVEIARTASNVDVRKAAVQWLGQRSGEIIVDELMKVYTAEPNAEIRKSVIAALSHRGNPSARVRLLEIARSNADLEVRGEAIQALGRKGDETIVDDLIRIYDSEQNERIRRSVLYALSRTRSARADAKIGEIARTAESVEVRREAMRSVARRNPQQAIDVLVQMYGTEKSNEVKMEIISALSQLAPKPVAGQLDNDAATRKIAEIARTESNPQLREVAIYALVRRSGGQTVTSLIQFYDADQSEQVKARILRSLGSVVEKTNDKQALRKLMDVAKSDASLALRKAAVTYLSRSKDPDAQRFIEEILK